MRPHFGSLGLALTILIGCGPREVAPVPVSGEVLLDKQPMPEGKIQLSGGGQAPVDMDIRDGKFEGKIKPGTYDVKIGIYKKAVLPPDFPMKGVDPGVKNILPDRFHMNSTMKATVTADGPNRLEYKVESK